ncbi:MAG: hypothetical protein ACRC35_05250 [Angustibacter sp.]
MAERVVDARDDVGRDVERDGERAARGADVRARLRAAVPDARLRGPEREPRAVGVREAMAATVPPTSAEPWEPHGMLDLRQTSGAIADAQALAAQPDGDVVDESYITRRQQSGENCLTRVKVAFRQGGCLQ